ncbi:Transcription repressor OFP17 [Rhynchospora pubera]|uniref:Transcription repressor OFP17 n=1 Tax=Rhynchospora pubera TaxID=906938 RepID=A0AAV8GLE9_9POAL|nr:Transcription repressor OFP17 [Rhynchospora pubera]
MPNPSTSFTCNTLFKPCKKLLRLIKRPIAIRAFRFRNLRKAMDRMSPGRRRRSRFRSVRAVFWPLITKSEDTDQVTELPSLPERVPAPVPSPVTPSYVKMMVEMREGESVNEEENDGVNNACKTFESYLMEMLVEERKVRDLMDVEELMHCWERLKSPVFIELVCRFYGELCKDLFPREEMSIDESASEVTIA